MSICHELLILGGVLFVASGSRLADLDDSLAYHEIRLMLSYLLWNFDIELCKESENWMDQQVFVLWSKHPLMVKVTPVAG